MNKPRSRGLAAIISVAAAGVLLAAGGVVLAGTAEARSATVPSGSATGHAGAAPIGTGWQEIPATYRLDQPPGKVRHTLINGEHHLWLFNDDPDTYPGRDAGPRSEMRIENDYRSGQAQFQADIKVAAGCTHASIMQIFGASGRATSFMAWAMPTNRLAYYNSSKTIDTPIYGRYLTLNVLHDTANGQITVYVDGALKGTFHDNGKANHYFKVGIYHQPSMSSRCDVYVKNLHVYKK